MADRYLYFILPGLIGGSVLALAELGRRSGVSESVQRGGRFAGGVLVCALLAFFATEARVALYVDELRTTRDAAHHYPNGALGQYIAAVDALEEGDPDRALGHLRSSADQGGNYLHAFYGDPLLVDLRGDPRFHELMREIARKEIDYALSHGLDNQQQLLGLAGAYFYLGDLDEAIEVGERALRQGGHLQSELSQMVFGLRAERARRKREGDGAQPSM
jgi:tetratricopeptide (TPR) repeat protein